jgi:BirA family transcriptional regulator, biotin operon repressor / biotin---[acetyl-CoA-carboxylase] ligase
MEPQAMTSSDLERALAIAGLAAPVHWQEVTGSTNAVAVALAAEGAPEWTLVGAGHQTAGRGRLGREWRDRPGESLMTSVVVRPMIAPDRLGLITLLAGAAWAEAATAVTGLAVRCKWPNDLVVGEAKAGGLLAESSVERCSVRWVVIGSGINLVAPADVEGALGLGADLDRAGLLGGFLSGLREGLRQPRDGFAGHVVARWSDVSATLGRRVAAVGTDGGRREGVAFAVDAAGRLVLETADGPVAVASDEIRHLR